MDKKVCFLCLRFERLNLKTGIYIEKFICLNEPNRNRYNFKVIYKKIKFSFYWLGIFLSWYIVININDKFKVPKKIYLILKCKNQPKNIFMIIIVKFGLAWWVVLELRLVWSEEKIEKKTQLIQLKTQVINWPDQLKLDLI